MYRINIVEVMAAAYMLYSLVVNNDDIIYIALVIYCNQTSGIRLYYHQNIQMYAYIHCKLSVDYIRCT